MRIHHRILPPLVLLAVAAGALSAPSAYARKWSSKSVAADQEKDKADKDRGKGRDADAQTQAQAPGPMDVFADIERGWNAGNVDPILRHFGSQKVAISVQGTGPSGGTFSRNQSYYLLKDLFRYTLTRKFEFVQYRKPSDDGSDTFAVAERHYQKSDDGRLFKDKVYVSLHLERDGEQERWVVDEIKSIR
ncbi:MAG TPA: hypothetical protein VFU38_08260 [Candidatus Krumholzibacteria bacterium]|nr:hypothetical protein [Candidatus Krumholzibacteria bacterium]